jgi:hypothetical protein
LALCFRMRRPPGYRTLADLPVLIQPSFLERLGPVYEKPTFGQVGGNW